MGLLQDRESSYDDFRISCSFTPLTSTIVTMHLLALHLLLSTFLFLRMCLKSITVAAKINLKNMASTACKLAVLTQG